MENIDIRYVYRRRNEPELEPLLTYLESELDGTRAPYDFRSGLIDLAPILEIAVSFMFGTAMQPVIGKYFEGLFDGDGLKELGEIIESK